MIFKNVILGVILVIALAAQVGCFGIYNREPTGSEGPPAVSALKSEDEQKTIMDEFDRLAGNEAKPAEIAKFIDRNISFVSQSRASLMVNALEEIQKNNLPKLDEKFYESDEIQNKMRNVYNPGFDINKIDNIEDGDLKVLLEETRDGGYKVETAEGMYFPIINYEFHKKYSAYVTPDMKEYIYIMAVESDMVPAKDAAIVISWDEVLRRASNQEKFINRYGTSIKLNDVKQLYNKYVSFTIYGSNNTPLFKYDTKIMNPEARASYENFIRNGDSGGFAGIVKGLLDEASKSGYKLTDGVENYRRQVSENLSKTAQ